MTIQLCGPQIVADKVGTNSHRLLMQK